jgi:hypothetical protein
MIAGTITAECTRCGLYRINTAIGVRNAPDGRRSTAITELILRSEADSIQATNGAPMDNVHRVPRFRAIPQSRAS